MDPDEQEIIDTQCIACQWLVRDRGLCGFYVDDEAGKTVDFLLENDEGQVKPVDDCACFKIREDSPTGKDKEDA